MSGSDDAPEVVEAAPAEAVEQVELAQVEVEPVVDAPVEPVAEPESSEAPIEAAADESMAATDEAIEPDASGEPTAELPTSAGAMDDLQLKHLVEALIFASDKPVTAQRLRQLTRVSDVRRLEATLEALATDYQDRGLVLQQVSGGYQFRTRTQFSVWVQQLIAGRPVRLSRAQLETLAIVAYRQPITRPEIDDIRGVDSSQTLKLLLDRALVRVLGKKEEVGRPMLYGTTKEFLDFFSLGDLRELPTLREYSELTDESRRVISDRLGDEPAADASAADELDADAETNGHAAPPSDDELLRAYLDESEALVNGHAGEPDDVEVRVDEANGHESSDLDDDTGARRSVDDVDVHGPEGHESNSGNVEAAIHGASNADEAARARRHDPHDSDLDARHDSIDGGDEVALRHDANDGSDAAEANDGATAQARSHASLDESAEHGNDAGEGDLQASRQGETADDATLRVSAGEIDVDVDAEIELHESVRDDPRVIGYAAGSVDLDNLEVSTPSDLDGLAEAAAEELGSSTDDSTHLDHAGGVGDHDRHTRHRDNDDDR